MNEKKTHVIHVRLTEEEKKKLKEYADRYRCTLSFFIRTIIFDCVKELQRKNKDDK